MPIKLILDTNVFYNLGDGTLNLQTISSQPSEVLYYSPLTVLELAGKWNDRTFEARRNAAKAIISSKAHELPDPELLLTRDIFGYTPISPPLSLGEAVKAMAGSKSMKELTDGVEDLTSRIIRRVSVRKVHDWRLVTENKWVKDTIDIQADKIPGFSQWYSPDATKRKGPVPCLRGKKKRDFLASMTSLSYASAIIQACQHRALLGAKHDKALHLTKERTMALANAIGSIACYCAVYTQYLIRLITGRALPEMNDSSDIELFIYAIDDDHKVVTSEKKWKQLAEAAGFGNRVRLIRTKKGG